MPTIGFSLGTPMGKLSAQDMGVPDYAAALSKGLDLGAKPAKLSQDLLAQQLANKINTAKARYAMQSELANLQGTQASTGYNRLKTQQLQNEINRYNLLQNLLGGGSPQASGAPRPQMVPNVSIDSLNGGEQPGNIVNRPGIQGVNDYSDNGMPAEGPGPSKSASAYDTFPGRRANGPGVQPVAQPDLKQNVSNGMSNANKQVISQGNPSLYKVDDIYDKYPQLRKDLEAQGYKQTQTTKYDSKTGLTTNIVTKPSGKVEVSTLGSMNGEFSPATMANKTQSQKVINAITNARPIIQKIIDANGKGEIPGQWIGKYFSPDKDAAYISDVIQSSDTLAGALGFPGTNEGLHQAQQTVLRKPRESDSAYSNRLKTLLSDMDTREQTASNVLNKGVSTSSNKKSSSNDKTKNDPLGIR